MKRKGLTLIELLITLAVLSIFTALVLLLMSNYFEKTEKNIKLLDALRRLNDAGDKMVELLNRAAGPANSVELVSATEVRFDIILAGQKINARVKVLSETEVQYFEDDRSVLIPIENVQITFQSGSQNPETVLPLKLIVKTPNPFNPSSLLSLEYSIYPPGVR
ncbi:prepilin-type N-terminal cleavage/methylation domain-containing protein [Thermotoga caldifontis]|uniref:prepilin-type N-terminal cleavage/methylation domain-containing protein n=1 Tax=Thermotoga caldifontis TaxID=1508419 RepID=UPI000597194D|nr:prepilin-type N-terminal cleavage/methylation domain-containing protein [Thermotoga caldifontis]